MTSDLSLRHEMVTELFSTSLTDEQATAYRLSQDQVDFFHENGYLTGVKLLESEQIAALSAELTTFFQANHAGRELWYEYHSNESTSADAVLFHALGAWRIGPAFHDLLWNPAFTIAASQLLGGPVRFWHDQLFCKPALHGGVVAWHQDYSYWTRTVPLAHLTCWIALDDSDAENGCIQYVPGSHLWDLLPITGLAGDMNSIREVLNEDQWDRLQTPVAAEVKAGYATFHHPLMIHGSQANRTDRPRRASVLNVVRDGVKSATDTELLHGVPVVPKGEPLAGQFFPRLTT